MYLSKSELEELRKTRADWTVWTVLDNGRVTVTVESDAGWGNAGVRALGKHLDAIRGRARRVLRRHVDHESFGLEVVKTRVDSMNVTHSITFAAKVSGA